MRVVFMGTPDFSVPTLVALKEGGHDVVAVVTQPDKAKGRGKAVQFTPVKEKALEYGIPVYQPVKVRDPEFMAVLEELAPEIIVVVAFGQILPKAVLDLPKYGCVNVHASLLPMYRGAAPIQWAVIDGLEKTGVTIMQMDVGLDTGDMIATEEITLTPDETGGSLFDKLSTMGGPLLLKVMEDLEAGRATFTPQEGETCYAGMLKKEMGEIQWTKSANSIERLIRGLNPWPSAYTQLDGKTLKLWVAEVLPGEMLGAPGEVVHVTKQELWIQTGDGVLSVKELQLEGKKRMTTDAFLRGYSVERGVVLGKKE